MTKSHCITNFDDVDYRPMWPWEHVIFSYLLYSMVCRAYYRAPPGESEALVVAVAAVLPDLIDKPLAWQFGIFRTGYELGHSLFAAVPLAVCAGFVARRYRRPRVGLAFGIGYLSHLLGDVIPIYLSSGEWTVRHLLWPVVASEGQGHDGFAVGVKSELLPYLEPIVTLEPTPYLSAQLAIATGAVLLWILDGTPGWRLLYRLVRRVTPAERPVDSDPGK